MSDHLPETESFAELGWCPECQSPPTSDAAHVQYCHTHSPATQGESDRLVNTDAYLSGGGEAGGVDNRLMCEFLHRGRKENVS
jgi:hypothetical protein